MGWVCAIICIVTLQLAQSGVVNAQMSGTEAALERQDGMKSADDALKTVKASIDTGTDIAMAELYAQAIADWARKMPTLFPANSGRQAQVKTSALDEIWREAPEFNRRAARLVDEAATLARALRANNPLAAAAAYAETADACRSCHAKFRADY